MKLAILMDELTTLTPNKDTTVAMIKSAQLLDWSCVYFTANDLRCRDGQAFASVSAIEIEDESQPDWAKTQFLGEVPLAQFDIILMRKDPPFDLNYIYMTYALELAEKQGVLVANRPQSLRDANEKFFTLNFPECCPKTLVCRDMVQLKAFHTQHRNVIFKPLEGMGGSQIFHVDENTENLSVILEVLTEKGQRFIMAQSYIPAIKNSGDKRILMINGSPIPYALARIPQPGDLRGNLAAGGNGIVVPLSARDHEICERLMPALVSKGLYFVGIDVIGDYLTEINVTSPTCAREITTATGIDITGQYLLGLAAMVDNRI